ncbi:F-box protein of unknown function [Balamuthia mandrillaris]
MFNIIYVIYIPFILHIPVRKERKKEMSFDGLSNELMLSVFQHLDPLPDLFAVSLTCKRWHTLSEDLYLWRSFYRRDIGQDLEDARVTPLSVASKHVQRLKEAEEESEEGEEGAVPLDTAAAFAEMAKQEKEWKLHYRQVCEEMKGFPDERTKADPNAQRSLLLLNKKLSFLVMQACDKLFLRTLRREVLERTDMQVWNKATLVRELRLKAASVGNLPLLKHLVLSIRGEDFFKINNSSDRYPLWFVALAEQLPSLLAPAALNGFVDVARWLLEEMDVAITPMAIREVCTRGHLPLLQYFFSQTAPSSDEKQKHKEKEENEGEGKGRTKKKTYTSEELVDLCCSGMMLASPICLAAREGREEICRYLLEEQGAASSKHFFNKQGFSEPLLIAALSGHVSIMKLFLQFGATAKGMGTEEILSVLTKQNVNAEALRLLLEHGANIQCTGPKAYPLYISTAIQNGNLEVCRLLAEHGADINACSLDNKTPLLYAVQSQLKKMCYCLTVCGADPRKSCADSSSPSPLRYAQQYGLQNILEAFNVAKRHLTSKRRSSSSSPSASSSSPVTNKKMPRKRKKDETENEALQEAEEENGKTKPTKQSKSNRQEAKKKQRTTVKSDETEPEHEKEKEQTVSPAAQKKKKEAAYSRIIHDLLQQGNPYPYSSSTFYRLRNLYSASCSSSSSSSAAAAAPDERKETVYKYDLWSLKSLLREFGKPSSQIPKTKLLVMEMLIPILEHERSKWKFSDNNRYL